MATYSNKTGKGLFIEEWLDDDSSVPLKVQRKLAALLEDHPEGIKITDLSKLYRQKYKSELFVLHYEASSLLQLVGRLNKIFRQIVLSGENITLFPAYLPESEQERNVRNEIDNTPNIIKENMKKLLNAAKFQNPALGGIYYEEFLDQYEEFYKVPLEFQNYNCSTFDEFIAKQMKTWLKQEKVNGRSVLVYFVDEEGCTTKELYPLNLLQKMDRSKFPPDVLAPHECLEKLNLCEEFKVGDKVDVCITEAVSCDRFYMQLKKYINEVEALDKEIDDFYENERSTVKLPYWVLASGMFCATYYSNKEWYRVLINQVFKNRVCSCYYVDSGKMYNLKPENMYYLKQKFSKLPMQAICSSLADAEPICGSWDDGLKKRFRNLTKSGSIVAEIVSIDPVTPHVTVNLFADGKNLLDILVSEKLAKKIDNENNLKYFDVEEEEIIETPEIEISDKDDKLPNDSINDDCQPPAATENCQPLLPSPINFNTPPPFHKTKSMPVLSIENKTGTSTPKSSNNSLNNAYESQEKLSDFAKSISKERPPRSSSTPAVVENTPINSHLNSSYIFTKPPPSPFYTGNSSLASNAGSLPSLFYSPTSSSSPAASTPPAQVPFTSIPATTPPPPTPLPHSTMPYFTPSFPPNLPFFYNSPFYSYPRPMIFPTNPVPEYFNAPSHVPLGSTLNEGRTTNKETNERATQGCYYPQPHSGTFYNGWPNWPGSPFTASMVPPPGFDSRFFSQQFPYGQPPWMPMNYFYPQHNGVFYQNQTHPIPTPAPAPPPPYGSPLGHNDLNMNHLSKEPQPKLEKNKEINPSYCLPKLSETSLLDLNTPNSAQNKTKDESVASSCDKRSKLPKPRRPRTKISDSFLTEQTNSTPNLPVLLEVEIVDLNIYGQTIHKVVLNNKAYFIESEILKKFSSIVDSDVLHKNGETCSKFVPSRSQYPLLYDKLTSKNIVDSMEDVHLIPINEFPRSIYLAGVTSKQILREALGILMKHTSSKDFLLDDIQNWDI